MSVLGFAGDRFCKTFYFAHGGTGSGNSPANPAAIDDKDLCSLDAGVVIEKVAVIVDVAVTGTTVVDVGDDDDADGFVPNASITLGTPGMYGYGAKAAGAYLRTETAGATDPGDIDVTDAAKYYSAAGKELKLATTTASTAGEFRVVVWGTRLRS